MHLAGPNARFRSLVKRSGRDIPLAEGALLIAEAEYPGLDVASVIARLDAHADTARRAIAAQGATGRRAVEILGAYLFRDVGLRGNRDDYYDPRNSYLNEVIERRLGIPISLSIVYCEIGRRAGLRPEPVGFPGHFLVKHELGPGDTLVVDPFEAGRVLTPADLEKLLEARFGLEIPYGRELLRAAEPREVLARVLRNLKQIYLRQGETERAFRTVDQILILEPQAREERRDRGLLAAKLGRIDRALCDLVSYTQALPDNLERRKIRGEIDELRRKRAELN
jgi:regulator of sirC expression with transglutaminase-like and TPR domain